MADPGRSSAPLVRIGATSVGQAIVWTSVLFCALSTSCRREDRPRIEPVYDQKTGRLKLLKYDSDADGKVDTWSYMDGSRVLRIEIDTDADGRIDRWEHYDADGKLLSIGLSRARDGVEDARTYAGPDGAVARIEVSTRRDGKANRTEYYAHDVLVRADEDTDGDGAIDKWETYDGDRLASVAFDTGHRGSPDRRLTYDRNGSVRVEIDSRGDGNFVEDGR